MSGGRMNSFAFLQAAKIMKKLEAHPCANPFKKEEVLDEFTKKRYNSVVTHPITLSEINLKIAMMQYETVQQWENDILLLADNATKLYGRYSGRAILAQELLRLFDKEFVKFVSFNQTKWARLFGETSHKIQFTLNKIPEEVKMESFTQATLYTFVGNDSVDEEVVEKPKKKIIIYDDDFELPPPKVVLPCSDEEVNRFLTAVSDLNSMHDVRALGAIIEKYQPELMSNEAEIDVDLSQLQPKTMKELIKYAKDRYKKQGRSYPN